MMPERLKKGKGDALSEAEVLKEKGFKCSKFKVPGFRNLEFGTWNLGLGS